MTGYFQDAPHLLRHIDIGTGHNLDAEHVYECEACVDAVRELGTVTIPPGATYAVVTMSDDSTIENLIPLRPLARPQRS